METLENWNREDRGERLIVTSNIIVIDVKNKQSKMDLLS